VQYLQCIMRFSEEASSSFVRAAGQQHSCIDLRKYCSQMVAELSPSARAIALQRPWLRH
jgi:hypothetical protein